MKTIDVLYRSILDGIDLEISERRSVQGRMIGNLYPEILEVEIEKLKVLRREINAIKNRFNH